MVIHRALTLVVIAGNFNGTLAGTTNPPVLGVVVIGSAAGFNVTEDEEEERGGGGGVFLRIAVVVVVVVANIMDAFDFTTFAFGFNIILTSSEEANKTAAVFCVVEDEAVGVDDGDALEIISTPWTVDSLPPP